MRGIITGFDAFVVVLDSDGKQQVIYKHAFPRGRRAAGGSVGGINPAETRCERAGP